MAITIEQIHAIADQLTQQGVKPTQMNVREVLGGGSFTTIAEGLRTWRQEQETAIQLQAVVIPQDITDRTQILIAQLWETAQQLANDRLAKEREILEHKQAVMFDEVEQAQLVVKTLENEQAELLAQLDQLTAKSDNQAEQLTQAQQNHSDQARLIATLQGDLDTSNRRAEELGEQLNAFIEKYDNQTAKIETLTANLATAKAERATATAQATQQAEKAETLLKDLSDTSQENAILKGRNETLNAQLIKADSLTQAQAEKIEKLIADLATAHANQPKPPINKIPKTKTPNTPKTS